MMNKIYRLKFDRRRNRLVVVSELTRGAGKDTGRTGTGVSLCGKMLGRLTPLALLTGLVTGMLPLLVQAQGGLPTGGQVVAGSGSISSAGSRMTVQQHSDRMVATWSTFDIGKGQTVEFVQPGQAAVALNRVTGGRESQIMGTLKANGQVMLVNPAGVLFGQGAQVNTAGLVATTKNISNEDFLRGTYRFSGGAAAGAEVVNQGSLTTTAQGYIVLAGDRVKNSGTVRTPGGKAVLAAGESVSLQLDAGGLTSVSVNGSVVNALVENSGLMSATDGRVYLTARGKSMLLDTVVNNSGTVEAKGLESRGGEIVLSGGDSGVVRQSGRLLADSAAGRGGRVVVEGENIHLAAGSRTSATGKSGGGDVYVGGGWQGKDSRIRNASKVVMSRGADIDVSATGAGAGGTAVVWSDDYTHFRGKITAKGGKVSGDGGRVETSSRRNLQAFGDVDVSPEKGRGGEWLLDPTDVTVVAGDSLTSATERSPGGEGTLDTDTAVLFTPSAGGAQIGVEKITAQLNRGSSVTVKTSGHDAEGQRGNITVSATVSKTAGSDATLTLLADNNIAVNANISSTAGKLGLSLMAGNTTDNAGIVIARSKNISLNGGDFYAGPADGSSNNVSLNITNGGQISAGNVTMNLAGGLSGYAYGVQTTGNLTVSGPVSGKTGWGSALRFLAGERLNISAPTVNLSSTEAENGGGKVLLSGAKGVEINTRGDLILLAQNNAGSSVNVSSTGGTVNLNAAAGRLQVEKGEITGVGGVVLGAASTTEEGQDKSVLSLKDTVLKTTGTGGNVVVAGKSTQGAGGITFSNVTVSSSGAGGSNLNITGESSTGTGVRLEDVNFDWTGKTVVRGKSSARDNTSKAVLLHNVNIKDNDSLINGNIDSTSQGTGIIIMGNLSTSGRIEGSSGRGVGVLVDRGAVLSKAAAIGGISGSWKAVEVKGDLGDSKIFGEAGKGVGVEIYSGSRVGVKGEVSGQSSGVGVGVVGDVQNHGKIIGEVVNGDSESIGIYISGNLSGAGTVSGDSPSGSGVRITSTGQVENIVSGITTTGVGVEFYTPTVKVGGKVNGTSKLDGKGIEIIGNLVNNSIISGHSGRGPGVVFNNNVEITGSGIVKGSSLSGSAVIIEGNLIGGTLTEDITRSKGGILLMGGRLTKANISGTSINITGPVIADGGSLVVTTPEGIKGIDLLKKNNGVVVRIPEKPKDDSSSASGSGETPMKPGGTGEGDTSGSGGGTSVTPDAGTGTGDSPAPDTSSEKESKPEGGDTGGTSVDGEPDGSAGEGTKVEPAPAEGDTGSSTPDASGGTGGGTEGEGGTGTSGGTGTEKPKDDSSTPSGSGETPVKPGGTGEGDISGTGGGSSTGGGESTPAKPEVKPGAGDTPDASGGAGGGVSAGGGTSVTPDAVRLAKLIVQEQQSALNVAENNGGSVNMDISPSKVDISICSDGEECHTLNAVTD
ncbi:filamentous hemagglutinin N-terminal domain-containing protein [Salmonella enterica]|nr:filamentous hemagglutinin N-terminal domain-containing protein [Salmonella enterica]